MQYDDEADEQLHGVQVAVLQSSSSSSSSVTEQRNSTDAQLPDTAAVQTSWEVFGVSSEPTDEDNCTPMPNGNELWKAAQPANVVIEVASYDEVTSALHSASSLVTTHYTNYSCYTTFINLDYSQVIASSVVSAVFYRLIFVGFGEIVN